MKFSYLIKKKKRKLYLVIFKNRLDEQISNNTFKLFVEVLQKMTKLNNFYLEML